MINILICDDDIKIINEVKKLLHFIKNNTKMDFCIETKNNANFINKTNIKYDIAILDIEMPGTNGLALASTLKDVNPDIIIIIMTSFSDYLDSAMGISVLDIFLNLLIKIDLLIISMKQYSTTKN